MKKKVLKISMLPAALALVFLSFTKKEKSYYELLPKENTEETVSNKVLFSVDTVGFNYVRTKKNYTGFKAALAFKESQGHYGKVNQFGYLGKYQFGQGTLSMIGVYDMTNFLNNPRLQERALYANLSRNKWVLRNYIDRYAGKIIGGVQVTESGILAAAHLAGPGGVKKFLRTGGVRAFSDAFGTSIKHYMYEFGGYDVSFVKADKKAKATSL